MQKFRFLKTLCSVLALMVMPLTVQAQNASPLPKLPVPIQNLVNEGAQIRYLGKDYGLDAWITIKNGREQYFYVLPDQSAFLTAGMLFDSKAQNITIEQVRRLQENESDVLDILADDYTPAIEQQQAESTDRLEFKSPSEQLFYDIENSNWVSLGQAGAPIMYSFIDPMCPHCHEMIKDLKVKYLDTGRMQLRIIPIGFREETRAQAAFLLAAPDSEERLYKHLQGDKEALPARSEINQQGVQRNLAIMQAWKFDVTPMNIYRAKDGTVKIVRGRPQDITNLVGDLGSRI